MGSGDAAGATSTAGAAVGAREPAAGTVTVRVLTDDDARAALAAAVTELLAGAGVSELAVAVQRGLRWELPEPADRPWRAVQKYAFLLGLPAASCCATHDEDRTEAFVQAVLEVCTGTR